jgi:hypothetical protein
VINGDIVIQARECKLVVVEAEFSGFFEGFVVRGSLLSHGISPFLPLFLSGHERRSGASS